MKNSGGRGPRSAPPAKATAVPERRTVMDEVQRFHRLEERMQPKSASVAIDLNSIRKERERLEVRQRTDNLDTYDPSAATVDGLCDRALQRRGTRLALETKYREAAAASMIVGEVPQEPWEFQVRLLQRHAEEPEPSAHSDVIKLLESKAFVADAVYEHISNIEVRRAVEHSIDDWVDHIQTDTAADTAALRERQHEVDQHVDEAANGYRVVTDAVNSMMDGVESLHTIGAQLEQYGKKMTRTMQVLASRTSEQREATHRGGASGSNTRHIGIMTEWTFAYDDVDESGIADDDGDDATNDPNEISQMEASTTSRRGSNSRLSSASTHRSGGGGGGGPSAKQAKQQKEEQRRQVRLLERRLDQRKMLLRRLMAQLEHTQRSHTGALQSRDSMIERLEATNVKLRYIAKAAERGLGFSELWRGLDDDEANSSGTTGAMKETSDNKGRGMNETTMWKNIHETIEECVEEMRKEAAAARNVALSAGSAFNFMGGEGGPDDDDVALMHELEQLRVKSRQLEEENNVFKKDAEYREELYQRLLRKHNTLDHEMVQLRALLSATEKDLAEKSNRMAEAEKLLRESQQRLAQYDREKEDEITNRLQDIQRSRALLELQLQEVTKELTDLKQKQKDEAQKQKRKAMGFRVEEDEEEESLSMKLEMAVSKLREREVQVQSLGSLNGALELRAKEMMDTIQWFVSTTIGCVSNVVDHVRQLRDQVLGATSDQMMNSLRLCAWNGTYEVLNDVRVLASAASNRKSDPQFGNILHAIDPIISAELTPTSDDTTTAAFGSELLESRTLHKEALTKIQMLEAQLSEARSNKIQVLSTVETALQRLRSRSDSLAPHRSVFDVKLGDSPSSLGLLDTNEMHPAAEPTAQQKDNGTASIAESEDVTAPHDVEPSPLQQRSLSRRASTASNWGLLRGSRRRSMSIVTAATTVVPQSGEAEEEEVLLSDLPRVTSSLGHSPLSRRHSSHRLESSTREGSPSSPLAAGNSSSTGSHSGGVPIVQRIHQDDEGQQVLDAAFASYTDCVDHRATEFDDALAKAAASVAEVQGTALQVMEAEGKAREELLRAAAALSLAHRQSSDLIAQHWRSETASIAMMGTDWLASLKQWQSTEEITSLQNQATAARRKRTTQLFLLSRTRQRAVLQRRVLEAAIAELNRDVESIGDRSLVLLWERRRSHFERITTERLLAVYGELERAAQESLTVTLRLISLFGAWRNKQTSTVAEEATAARAAQRALERTVAQERRKSATGLASQQVPSATPTSSEPASPTTRSEPREARPAGLVHAAVFSAPPSVEVEHIAVETDTQDTLVPSAMVTEALFALRRGVQELCSSRSIASNSGGRSPVPSPWDSSSRARSSNHKCGVAQLDETVSEVDRSFGEAWTDVQQTVLQMSSAVERTVYAKFAAEQRAKEELAEQAALERQRSHMANLDAASEDVEQALHAVDAATAEQNEDGDLNSSTTMPPLVALEKSRERVRSLEHVLTETKTSLRGALKQIAKEKFVHIETKVYPPLHAYRQGSLANGDPHRNVVRSFPPIELRSAPVTRSTVTETVALSSVDLVSARGPEPCSLLSFADGGSRSPSQVGGLLQAAPTTQGCRSPQTASQTAERDPFHLQFVPISAGEEGTAARQQGPTEHETDAEELDWGPQRNQQHSHHHPQPHRSVTASDKASQTDVGLMVPLVVDLLHSAATQGGATQQQGAMFLHDPQPQHRSFAPDKRPSTAMIGPVAGQAILLRQVEVRTAIASYKRIVQDSVTPHPTDSSEEQPSINLSILSMPQWSHRHQRATSSTTSGRTGPNGGEPPIHSSNNEQSQQAAAASSAAQTSSQLASAIQRLRRLPSAPQNRTLPVPSSSSSSSSSTAVATSTASRSMLVNSAPLVRPSVGLSSHHIGRTSVAPEDYGVSGSSTPPPGSATATFIPTTASTASYSAALGEGGDILTARGVSAFARLNRASSAGMRMVHSRSRQ